jgi:hypothetical protein
MSDKFIEVTKQKTEPDRASGSVKFAIIQTFFIKSSGILLTLTALAKLFTAYTGSRIIDLHDPILGFQFRHEFLAIGILELTIACVCLLANRVGLQLGLIAWLGTCFAVYRVGLLWIGGVQACPCLGNFSDAIHLSKAITNDITSGIVIYFLVGSYSGLLNKCLRKSE